MTSVQIFHNPSCSKSRGALQILEELGLIERERNFGASERTPWRTRVADNAVRFWYRFVLPNRSRLERGKVTEVWKAAVAPSLDTYMGKVLERIAREAYTRYHEEWKLPIDSAWARWEGQDRNRRNIELDIVASLDDGRMLLGEIKWSSRAIGPEVHAQVLRNDAANIDALYALAQIACQEGRFGDGVDLSRAALTIDPSRARAHNLLGMALARLERREEALASFDAAIARAPELADAHGNRGDVLAELGRLADAVESYDRALQFAPDSIETWCNRGAALSDLGRHVEALASYDRVLALKPDFAEVHFNRGNMLNRLARYEEAPRSVAEEIIAKVQGKSTATR